MPIISTTRVVTVAVGPAQKRLCPPPFFPADILALSPNFTGSLFMVGAMASFSVTDAISKFLLPQMNFGQLVLLRGVVAIVLITTLAAHRGALRPLRILFVPQVAMRIVGEVGGTILFLLAITHLPLANVAAIILSLPLAITLGAVLMFGERVGWRRWLAIAAGFVGVLIIVRPGAAGFNQFTLLALGSVAFYALRDLATKQVPADIPALFVTLLTTISMTAVGGLMVMPLGGWTTPSVPALALLTVAAVLVLAGYQCVIMALRVGDISAVAPFRYTQLLWAMLLGYLIFGDVPDGAMIVGATIIVASGLYTFHREHLRNREMLMTAKAGSVPADGP
ncbi:DMT family transporter [Rhodopseudomonas boonkerdii]|uniref:DMT family transporter n=1 Tax=Rhodopseudomonas boonkerdii TaxID=475937 RepID=UPI001E5D1634|nr:DMT family transporter [Rhodopseudomonas boonkerdii]